MPPPPPPCFALPPGYGALLADLKSRVRSAQVKAALAVNSELVHLYWQIGRSIEGAQHAQGWGAKVVDRLSADLQKEFPEMTGFSPRNLRYMRDFAAAWPDRPILQRVVAKLPWGHNIDLLTKLGNEEDRDWYARKAVEHGWSRPILCLQIQSRLRDREGRAITNFSKSLPHDQAHQAQQILKDPYNFDFLTLAGDAKERELERGLMDHVQKLLLELGLGFAFVGRQVPFEVDGEDFRVDLLFYHLKLRCFLVVDLKARPFEPEFAGKLNFYLSVVDDRMRHPQDAPTIGLLLVQGKTRTKVECALRDIGKPIGVAEWTTQPLEDLPQKLQEALPSASDLEHVIETAAAARSVGELHDRSPRDPSGSPRRSRAP